MAANALFRKDKPVFDIRAIHLDLKGVPPTAERLVSLLDVIATARYNAIVVEWEDSFPWTVDERFRSETAYTPDEVRRFHDEAKKRGIEIVPLVQCLGHMETALIPGYEHLRELPHMRDIINPLAPGARQLIEAMVEDVLNLTPHLRYFHLGGDEAWAFGSNPETKAYIEKHGKGALYLKHVEPILDMLNERGIRPILWHDMMKDWDGDSLRQLAKKADLCVWGYNGHPDTVGDKRHFSTTYIQRFHDHDVPMWCATAYKGADGPDTDLPNIERREVNATAWAEVGGRFNMKACVATAWSRYNTGRCQNEPIDGALDALLYVGVIMHDGEAPAGGVAACEQALEKIRHGESTERDTLQACRTTLANLSRVRSESWNLIRDLRQQLVTEAMDPRRRGTRNAYTRLDQLENTLREADRIVEEMHRVFQGLIDPIWIQRYLGERIEPLREEIGPLKSRAWQLSPQAYEGYMNPSA
ncbi:family 20 glycosylhydrolase [bacterium]|nr:family 20 glycosylhydrolase [bacterium]